MDIYTHGGNARRHFAELYGKSTYAQFIRYQKLVYNFKKQYNHSDCYLLSSSGRVEFCGNHTDHNGGRVIGCSVNLDIVGAFKANNGSIVRIQSAKHPAIEFTVGESVLQGGAAIAQNVINYLLENGYNAGGFDLYTDSLVLNGAGISSSAAYEMLIANIVNELFNGGVIQDDVLAKAGQYAEQVSLNKPCGLLDQGAVLSGGMTEFDFKGGFACKRLNARTDGIKLVLIDTGKSHANLSHLYAAIPSDMYDVAKCFNTDRLIDVKEDDFYNNFDKTVKAVGLGKANRAKHFFEENARVDRLSVALEQGNVEEIIRIVNQSGDSSINLLRNCAVDENDTAISDAVTFARSLGNVGARVHGGGFAGTVLCVIPSSIFADVFAALCAKYGESKILPMRIRPVGVKIL